MKQTAVEWLQQALEDTILDHEQIMQTIGLFEQAKEMEKEQMVNAFEKSRLTHPMIGFKHETFKDYYKETFNTNEK
jgi:disulfide oxidoreductase YuzD